MKGLLIKDFKLLKNQKQFFLTVSMMGIIFLVVSNNPDFVISYITIMISIFTLSTISYDQYNNGMAYLFTLPITRKEYVGEKYVFGLISTAASLAGVSAIAYAVAFVKCIEIYQKYGEYCHLYGRDKARKVPCDRRYWNWYSARKSAACV